MRKLFSGRGSGITLKLIITFITLLSLYPASIVFADNSSALEFYRYQKKTDEWVRTDQGQINEGIRIHGNGFETGRRYYIYLSSQEAKIDDILKEKINTYEQVAITSTGEWTTELDSSFVVPKELNDGENNKKVEYGTYYVYVVHEATERIVAKSTFIVIEQRIEISAEQSHIGDWVVINGSGFGSKEQVEIYFSSNAANIGDYIDSNVTAYEIAGFLITDTFGDFSEAAFQIPERLSTGNEEVHTGDYYFYATRYFERRRIKAISTLTVVSPAISLTPSTGIIGTEVQISGQGFGSNQTIKVKYDGSDINVITEENVTDGSGQFRCAIIVPPSLAGDHSITVTDMSGYKHEAQFTVEPRLSIEPTTAVTGTQVKIIGADFRSNQKITVKYDNEQVNVASGDVATDDTGKCNSSIIIPESITGNHTITVADEYGNISKAVYNIQANVALSSTLKTVENQERIYLVQVSGTGFGKTEAITLSLDNKNVTTLPPYLRTNDKGSFDCSFEVLFSNFIGIGTVVAQDSKSGSAEAQLSIMDIIQSKRATSPGISLSPASSAGSPGHAGMLLKINGVGFNAKAKITLDYDDKTIAVNSVITDSIGNFSVTFTVPNSTSGSHTISARDGINNATSTFIMEADRPPTPKLLSPQFSQTVESEFVFLWDAVDDVSGVSYVLQVSSDADFTTLLLNKMGIVDSIYKPSEEENLKLTKRETPYYWRVKAVDGAYNESEWAPAASFYVNLSPAVKSDWTKFIFYGVAILIVASGILYIASRVKWQTLFKR